MFNSVTTLQSNYMLVVNNDIYSCKWGPRWHSYASCEQLNVQLYVRTAGAQRLKGATNRKVAGSIPAGVIGIFH